MKIVIVGNGVAGTTCALESRKRDPNAEIILIGKETTHFFSRTALMYVLLGKMKKKDLEPLERDVYTHQNIQLRFDTLTNIHCRLTSSGITCIEGLEFKQAGTIKCDKLVLALGAAPRMFPWKGLEKFPNFSPTSVNSQTTGIVHFVSYQDMEACETLMPTTKHAIVVGGGLIGIELVECLLQRGIQVTFLIREPYFWPVALNKEEAEMVEAHMRHHGVNLCLGEEIAEISAGENGRISSVLTSKGNLFPAEFLGVCVGVAPNIEQLKTFSSSPKTARGIVVNRQFETSIENVYSCGDCAEIMLDESQSNTKTILETIWYSAKRQGALVAKSVFGDAVNYTPPTFFNSSKFFDIEYTTVGMVENAPKGSVNHTKKIANKNASLRIVTFNNIIVGMNVLGGRIDHEAVIQWIEEKRTLEFCIQNIKKIQYDVEFGRIKFETQNFVAQERA